MFKWVEVQAIRWLVTLCLLIFAVSRLQGTALRDALTWKTLTVLIVASLVLVGVVLLNAIRWQFVTRALSSPIDCRQAASWTMIGHSFNQIFPSSIGGDVVRGLIAARHATDKATVMTSLVLERMVGLLALLLLIAVGQPFILSRFPDVSPSRIAALIVVAGLLAVIFLSIANRISGCGFWGVVGRAATRLSADARCLLRSPWLAGFVLGISLVMHFTTLALTAWIANALGATVSFVDMVLVMPTVLLIASLPISIGGWGVREAALAVGFAALGQPTSVAVITSILIGLANLISAVPGAILWGLGSASDLRARDLSVGGKAA